MKRVTFALVYLLVLALSHLFPFLGRDSKSTASHENEFLRDSWEANWPSPTSNETDKLGPPIILFTDPRAEMIQWKQWVPCLSGDSRRILSPTTASPQSFSTRTSKDGLAPLVSRLETLLKGQPRGDLVAIGASGPVAIELTVLAPHLVRSLTLISATGVQEFQHLGDHHINHAIYLAQAIVSWTVRHSVPHFGAWQQFPWDPSWIDYLRQSDLRNVRDLLKQIDVPVLIIHQNGNANVSLDASRELQRLLPQSDLIVVPEKGVDNSNDETGKQSLRTFLNAVQNGTAVWRQEAPRHRQDEAKKPLTHLPPIRGKAFWVTLILIALATLISEDLTCISAGLMVGRGLLGFFPATLATLTGIFVGDILLFLAGRWIGQGALKRIPLKWLIDQSDIDRCAKWFDAQGPRIIIASRFLPGTRLPTYFGAGMMGAGFWMFTAFFLVACILWTPILVGVSAIVGREILAIFSTYERLALPILLMTIAGLWIAAKIIVPSFSFRGRRLLRAGWIRKTHWEFWPPYVFYIPVFIYVLYLGFRHRCLTLFTACNPAIPEGGFVGESKSHILSKLNPITQKVARFTALEGESIPSEKISKIELFMKESGVDFPIVVKPDVGERGFGVTIVKDQQSLITLLEQVSVKMIVQEYVPGKEFGIFYYRFPGEPKGHIFSITDKRFLHVTGDGTSSLEELILKHERAMIMAPTHMKTHGDVLYDVPEKGQMFPLVEVGTHCRGSIFLDGNHLLTHELESAIDQISRSFEGFYFGRYDIRCPSVEDLKKGINFKILELNGVTSEATHIYDPQNRLLSAYRVLKKQWQLAFEIGAENRKRGFQPASIRDLLSRISRRFS